MTAIREATHGPTLAWARCPDVAEEPPPLAEHDGRSVRWEDWEVAPEVVHLRQFGYPECERCGYDGQQWITTGLLLPHPGEMTMGTHIKRLPSGRTYEKEHPVPAWPIRRLIAYRCPACGADLVYDLGPSGKGWTLLADAAGQAALF